MQLASVCNNFCYIAKNEALWRFTEHANLRGTSDLFLAVKVPALDARKHTVAQR